jgi:hypothetical protein
MRQIITFSIGAVASLCILGYAVHMLIGGFFPPATETLIIAVTVMIGASAIGWMTWDVLRRR